MTARLEKKKNLIRLLGKFLGGSNQARMSILLQMKNEEAMQWATLRAASGIFGYVSEEEAEAELTELLG